MKISGCGETYEIVTDIKLKPIKKCLANYYSLLTYQVEELETPTDALFNLNHVELHQHQLWRSQFAKELVTSTHNWMVTQPEAKPTLYYTATELRAFNNESRSKVCKTL